MTTSDIERKMIPAAEVGNVREVTEYLAAGANANARNLSGDTALHRAALHGHASVVDRLLANGAAVNLQNHSGETALHLAALRDHQKVAELLLASGADVMARNTEGQTPRDYAKSGQCHDVHRLLETAAKSLSAGAPANWTQRTAAIQVGDTVAYSKRFLQSTGQYTGDAPQARGKVTSLTRLGSVLLAAIAWDRGAFLPAKVNVKNLSVVKDGVVMDRD